MAPTTLRDCQGPPGFISAKGSYASRDRRLTISWAACPLRELSRQGPQGGEFTQHTLKLLPPSRHALPLPNPAPSVPPAHPFRAKLAQNFITILLRLVSSSEAPSVERRQSHCYSKCGSGAAAALENLLEIQKRGPYSRPTESKPHFKKILGNSSAL